MKTKTTPAPAAATDPEVVVEILENGTLIHGCHHAAGKTMPLPKSKADVLASLTPPAVKIIGV
jgi:hypothetical protein